MKLRIRREMLDWHQGRESLKICHLSDLHLKWNRSRRRLAHIEDALQQEQPDLIALTGDYADTPFGADLACEFITHLSRSFPVFWIAGNHDRWFGTELWQPLHRLPHCHAIDKLPQTFTSHCGLQYEFVSWSQHLQTPHSPTSFKRRIILVHNPEILSPGTLQSTPASLILAGHLHGGQFVFWTASSTRHYPGSFLYRRCCNRLSFGPNQSTLIVSAGLGDTLPLRFRCPHEIVSITIR